MRVLSAIAAVSMLLASCSDRDSATPSQPTAEASAPNETPSPNGRVVGVAYVEMSGRVVVVREYPDGVLMACFWAATQSQARPLGCVPLE